jgi:hypothetical protein
MRLVAQLLGEGWEIHRGCTSRWATGMGRAQAAVGVEQSPACATSQARESPGGGVVIITIAPGSMPGSVP